MRQYYVVTIVALFQLNFSNGVVDFFSDIIFFILLILDYVATSPQCRDLSYPWWQVVLLSCRGCVQWCKNGGEIEYSPYANISSQHFDTPFSG